MTTIRQRPRAHRGPLAASIAIVLACVLVGCGTTVRADADDLRAPAPSTSTMSIGPSPAVAEAAPDRDLPRPSPDSSPRSIPVATPDPTASPTPVPAKFAMNLYRRGDFVAQYTYEWCVGASLQMALNMTTAKDDGTRSKQKALWEMAQSRSFSPFGGANPRGWTAALNDLGVGPYVLVSIPDFDEALRVAATAIRATKRPVGLVMWRGRHAWVMSGFESIGDPAVHPDFTVSGVRVLDPLYPRGSAAWGPSPKPNALLKPATLARQFVVRDSMRVDLGVPPGYLLVLPT